MLWLILPLPILNAFSQNENGKVGKLDSLLNVESNNKGNDAPDVFIKQIVYPEINYKPELEKYKKNNIDFIYPQIIDINPLPVLGDIGVYYKNNNIDLFRKDRKANFNFNVSNKKRFLVNINIETGLLNYKNRNTLKYYSVHLTGIYHLSNQFHIGGGLEQGFKEGFIDAYYGASGFVGFQSSNFSLTTRINLLSTKFHYAPQHLSLNLQNYLSIDLNPKFVTHGYSNIPIYNTNNFNPMAEPFNLKMSLEYRINAVIGIKSGVQWVQNPYSGKMQLRPYGEILFYR